MLFLHISDIHFKKTEVGQPDDPNRALRNDMVADVRAMKAKIGKPADGVIISGDIAFQGIAAEYDFAYNWLEAELCPAAGCPLENVFVVPGNHDVDRSRDTGPAQIAAREKLRATPVREVDDEVRKWLRDKVSAAVIFGPLEDYNRFAAKFLCALKPYSDDDEKAKAKASGEQTADSSSASGTAEEPPALPFAMRNLTLGDGSCLRIWGFSTVIVSDKHDDKDKMIIDPAAAQIEVEDGVTHMVVCHHPFNWLRNGAPFADRVNKVAKIQLFGHEHTQRMDEDKRYLRVRAGALQPDRDEPDWKPGYNWLDIDIGLSGEERTLVTKAWVRMRENNGFLAIPDPDGNEIWANSYKLPAWTAPRRSEQTVQIEEQAEPSLIPMAPDRPAVTVRGVTLKFFKLQEHEQRRVISQLSLDKAGDRDLKDYEQVIVAVRRSKSEGRLEELDSMLDKALSGEGQS